MELELDRRMRQDLLRLYTQEREDLSLSRHRLVEHATTFRDKFGPARLASLDGEALLEMMHGHGTKDSLVYWLEFKDDEEFDTSLFGSIAGGSAYKFGLFRKKETGMWTTGSSKSPIELSTEQAKAKAHLHRDQLIAGVQLLERMSAHSTKADYEHLQQEIRRVAYDVGSVIWGHKYFSILYPDILDFFHRPLYQRYHLIKLLQNPPQDDQRFFTAWYFTSIAQLLQNK